MGKIILLVILAAIVIFIAVLLIRTAMFKPEKLPPVREFDTKVNEEKIIADMADMIRCKTVSNRDESKVDRSEFEKFQKLIAARFPLVHEKAELTHLGKTGLLFYIKGRSSEKPSVCMAHYDVVPVDEDAWDKPPFDAVIEDGVMWGRGTLDTKSTLCSILEAAEQLLAGGFVPKNDLYLSFSGEEEIDGASCGEIVTYLENKGIKPAIVLDEGGAVVDKSFPGVDGMIAMVGIGEKGSVNMDFTVECEGGHASTPPKKTTAGTLAKAIRAIENNPFPRHFTKPVKEMFDTVGRHSTFGMRLIFANLWCLLPVLDLVCKISGGELNAMMRTTVAVTKLSGSDAYNVMPAKANFGVNMRVMSGDTIESAAGFLNEKINDDCVTPSLVNGAEPSIYSDTSCAEWQLLKETIHELWPEAIISPYLMMACSDSRHYCRITDRVYRFSPMYMSKEDRGMIHGNNERISLDTLLKTTKFYVRFIGKL